MANVPRERRCVLKRVIVLLFLVPATLASNVGALTPPVPGSHEFYWDDGIIANGWVWYTGGNYWSVQYDDLKTDGRAGWIEAFFIASPSGYPFTGCYFHVFDDMGGHPGVSLRRTFYDNYGYWVELDPEVHVSQSVFYGVMEQIGDSYSADRVGADIAAGTHNWTGYHGSWGSTTLFGDFMLRCYWEDFYAVEETSWGAVKALY